MKEEVKITVIATGFKSDQPKKREGAVTAAAAAISNARSVSSFTPSRPTELPAKQTLPSAPPANGAPAMAMQRTPAIPSRETPSLEKVKSSVSGSFEQDDLDVPAFIRKRGEH